MYIILRLLAVDRLIVNKLIIKNKDTDEHIKAYQTNKSRKFTYIAGNWYT